MINRVTQVFRTYTGLLSFWLLVACYVVVLAFGLAAQLRPDYQPDQQQKLQAIGDQYEVQITEVDQAGSDYSPAITATGILTTYLGVFIGLHLKRQFADPRSALVPGFAGPHLMVAGFLLLLGAVLGPIWLGWWLDIWIVGVVGLALLCSSLGLAYGWNPVNWVYLLMVIVAFTVIYPPFGQAVWVPGFSGSMPWAGWLTLITGAGLTAWVLYRLPHLTEESPAYGRESPFAGTIVHRARPQRGANRWKNYARKHPRFMRRADRRHANLVDYHTAKPWQRWQLWTLGMSLSSPLLMAAWYTLITAVALGVCWFSLGGTPISAAAALLGTGMITPIVVGQLLTMHWPYLALENMRPMSRHRMIAELFASLGLWAATLVAGSTAVIIAVLVALITTGPWPTLTIAVGLTLVMVQPLMVGLCIWFASYRSTLVFSLCSIVGLIVVGGCFIGPMYAIADGPRVRTSVLVIAMIVALAAAIGLAFLAWRGAYRRWCAVELG